MNLPEHISIIAGLLGITATPDDDGTEAEFTRYNIENCVPTCEVEDKAINYLLRYIDENDIE